MIEYEGRVFRPPSEAYSLIVQVTIGCSHNKCTFCDMYKEKRFRVRKLEEVKADFDEARRMYRRAVHRLIPLVRLRNGLAAPPADAAAHHPPAPPQVTADDSCRLNHWSPKSYFYAIRS